MNPTRRRRSTRRRRRSRNPLTGGLIGKAFTLAGAGAAIGLTQPFVSNFVRPYLGTLAGSPFVGAGITFGTSWLLSMGAGMFAFTRKWKDDILLAGGTIAAAQLISAYVLPALRIGNGAQGNGLGRRPYNNGLRGIAAIHGVPPQMMPPPPPQTTNGMQGIGVRPGNYAQ